jgi:hypothetical protein
MKELPDPKHESHKLYYVYGYIEGCLSRKDKRKRQNPFNSTKISYFWWERGYEDGLEN